MRALKLPLAPVALAALLLLGALPAAAADVLVVQAGRGRGYEEALGGFRSEYRGSSRTVVLSDYAEVDVARLAREEKARLVLTVGDAAMAASRKGSPVPVVALLSLRLDLPKEPPLSVGGVSVLPSPDRYLEAFRSLGARRVGVVHDPSRTGRYVERARQAARGFGVDLVVREVRSSRDVPARIGQMEGAVDALWMLPDATAVTSETLEAWFLFSLRAKVPVVTFSDQYLAKGAALSLDVDRADLGRQAAEMAKSLLSGGSTRPATVDARRTTTHANPAVARTLGIRLPAEAK